MCYYCHMPQEGVPSARDVRTVLMARAILERYGQDLAEIKRAAERLREWRVAAVGRRRYLAEILPQDGLKAPVGQVTLFYSGRPTQQSGNMTVLDYLTHARSWPDKVVVGQREYYL